MDRILKHYVFAAICRGESTVNLRSLRDQADSVFVPISTYALFDERTDSWYIFIG